MDTFDIVTTEAFLTVALRSSRAISPKCMPLSRIAMVLSY